MFKKLFILTIFITTSNVLCMGLSKGVESIIKKEQSEMIPLIRASRDGDMSRVIFLLVSGIDINGQNKYGETPLMVASAGGHKDIVKLLINRRKCFTK